MCQVEATGGGGEEGSPGCKHSVSEGVLVGWEVQMPRKFWWGPIRTSGGMSFVLQREEDKDLKKQLEAQVNPIPSLGSVNLFCESVWAVPQTAPTGEGDGGNSDSSKSSSSASKRN